METVSSITTTAAVPRPRQPTLPRALKSSLRVEFFFGEEAHADAAGNGRFAFAILPHAAAEIVDQLPTGDAQRRFVAAGFVHVAAEAVQLRAVAAGVARVFRIGRHADRFEPIDATGDDVRDAGHGFDVVHDGRFAERAFDGGERRLDARPGAFAFQAFNQPRLFAADVRRGAAMQENIEREIAAQDVLAQIILRVAFVERSLKPVPRQRILISQDINTPSSPSWHSTTE